MIQRDCFFVAAQLPSLAFATNLLTSSKGATKGLVVVGGPWYGSTEGVKSAFAPKFAFEAPSEKKRGRLVESFDKVAFERLSLLYQIGLKERDWEVLLTEKNLRALVRAPWPFIIPIFPRLAPPTSVKGEHFYLTDLEFFAVAQANDFEARSKKLIVREK